MENRDKGLRIWTYPVFSFVVATLAGSGVTPPRINNHAMMTRQPAELKLKNCKVTIRFSLGISDLCYAQFLESCSSL